MTFRHFSGLLLIVVAVLVAGCSKGNQQYKAGTKAESLNDYDTALENYNKELRADPNNTEFKLKAARARFEASTWHLSKDNGCGTNPTWSWLLASSGRP